MKETKIKNEKRVLKETNIMNERLDEWKERILRTRGDKLESNEY